MRILVRQRHGRTYSRRLVAGATGVDVAVGGTVARQDAVDRLHDVELTAGGPGGSAPHRVAQHPKRRPDALLVADRVWAEAQPGLDARHAARGRGQHVVRLGAARRPAAAGGGVAPGNELERLAAGQLDVARRAAVGLQLVVDADVAVDDVPFALVGEGAARSEWRLVS